MPLNYSEKDAKDLVSIVQALGPPFFFYTQSYCLHVEKWSGFTQDGEISFSGTAAF